MGSRCPCGEPPDFLVPIDRTEPAWICELRTESLDRLSRRYLAARATIHLSEVLEDPAVDALLIATPVFTRYELASSSSTASTTS